MKLRSAPLRSLKPPVFGAVQEGAPVLVTGSPPRTFPSWGYWVAGFGVLALAGALGYQYYRTR